MQSIVPEFADIIERDIAFLHSVKRLVAAETEVERKSLVKLSWAADQLVHDAVQLTIEQFYADVLNAMDFMHEPEFTEYTARYAPQRT